MTQPHGLRAAPRFATLALAATMLGIAGCGSSTGAGASAGASAGKPAPATLDLWLGGILTTATPGQGHTDFPAILDALRAIGYDDWVAVEILPHPSADEAAAQAITYLRTLVPASAA